MAVLYCCMHSGFNIKALAHRYSVHPNEEMVLINFPVSPFLNSEHCNKFGIKYINQDSNIYGLLSSASNLDVMGKNVISHIDNVFKENNIDVANFSNIYCLSEPFEPYLVYFENLHINYNLIICDFGRINDCPTELFNNCVLYAQRYDVNKLLYSQNIIGFEVNESNIVQTEKKMGTNYQCFDFEKELINLKQEYQKKLFELYNCSQYKLTSNCTILIANNIERFNAIGFKNFAPYNIILDYYLNDENTYVKLHPYLPSHTVNIIKEKIICSELPTELLLLFFYQDIFKISYICSMMSISKFFPNVIFDTLTLGFIKFVNKIDVVFAIFEIFKLTNLFHISSIGYDVLQLKNLWYANNTTEIIFEEFSFCIDQEIKFLIIDNYLNIDSSAKKNILNLLSNADENIVMIFNNLDNEIFENYKFNFISVVITEDIISNNCTQKQKSNQKVLNVFTKNSKYKSRFLELSCTKVLKHSGAKIIITAINAKTKSINHADVAVNFNNIAAVAAGNVWEYTSVAITPALTIKDDTKTLILGTDYTVAYSNNAKVGIATITITGKGAYSGNRIKKFILSNKTSNLNTLKFQFNRFIVLFDVIKKMCIDNVFYYGANIEQLKTLWVVNNGDEINFDVFNFNQDYKNSFVIIDDRTCTNEDLNLLNDLFKQDVNITVAFCDFLPYLNQLYLKQCVCVAINKIKNKIVCSEKDLSTQYLYVFSENKEYHKFFSKYECLLSFNNIGITLIAINVEFIYNDISTAKIEFIDKKIYTGKEWSPWPSVKSIAGKVLIKDVDYILSWSNNNCVGTGFVTINGIGDYFGQVVKPFYQIKSANYNIKNCKFVYNKEFMYTGLEVMPTPNVKNSNEEILKKSLDYILTYYKNVEIGEAIIIVTGIGDYFGCQILTFNIYDFEKDVYYPLMQMNKFSKSNLIFLHLPALNRLNTEYSEYEKFLIKDFVFWSYIKENQKDVVYKAAYEPNGVSYSDFRNLINIPLNYNIEADSPYVINKDDVFKVVNNRILTTDLPETFDNVIYVLGNSVSSGSYDFNDYTIQSCLQRKLNLSSAEKLKIRNYAVQNINCSWGQYYTPWLKKIKSIDFKDGDICVIIADFPHYWLTNSEVSNYIIDSSQYFKRPHKHNDKEIWADVFHFNRWGNDIFADCLYDELNKRGFLNIPKTAPSENTEQDLNTENTEQDLNTENTEQDLKIKEYIAELPKFDFTNNPKIVTGAIVMNCNPFTLGHRYLIEYASSKVDFLYIFAVEEDKSQFAFADRIELIRKGTADLVNVKVVPSGKFIISKETFKQYFDKAELQDIAIDPSYDVELFGQKIAPALNISIRFAGEEPTDNVTKQYNFTMKQLLPNYGIKVEIIPRKEVSGTPISASRVRAFLKDKNFDEIAKIVPVTTLEYLKERFI